MSTETTITRQIDPKLSPLTALKNIADDTLATLKTKFGNEYDVIAGNFPDVDKDWTHDIKVRKGNKIGAEVTIKWQKTNAKVVTLDVTDSSKLGNQITFITLIIFLAVGGYMGYNGIEPLAFLPGKKIAGGLGGLIALIPGFIIVAILKSILLKNEKALNAKLVNEVRLLINE